MVNSYTPHVLVLPEDQANVDIVNGFRLYPSFNERNFKVLPLAGGWRKVLDEFEKLIPSLRRNPDRRVILLIDFDNKFQERETIVRGRIPADLRDQVFFLGAAVEPEKLKSALRYRSSEKIGKELAEACANSLDESLWQHEQLRHNQPELDRLVSDVRPILFGRS